MKVKIKGFVHCHITDMERYNIFDCTMSEYGYICLGEIEVEADVPPLADRTAEAIRIYRAQQDKIQQKARDQIAGIEEQIRNLSLFTYTPEAA